MAGTWTQTEAAGHFVDVYVPAEARRPNQAILFLHGIGQETLVGQPAFTDVFDALGMACLSPHGKYSWWTNRLCPDFDSQRSAEDFVVSDVVRLAQELLGLGPPRLGLLGISMGGQGALRIAFRHPARFPAVAAISPAIDYYEYHGQGLSLDEMYDSKEQCRQDTATMHVSPAEYPPHIFFCIDPEDFPWYRGNDRLHEKLRALGIAHECDLSTRAGGHSWAYFNHMAERSIRFLHQGLAAQGRRLL